MSTLYFFLNYFVISCLYLSKILCLLFWGVKNFPLTFEVAAPCDEMSSAYSSSTALVDCTSVPLVDGTSAPLVDGTSATLVDVLLFPTSKGSRLVILKEVISLIFSPMLCISLFLKLSGAYKSFLVCYL